MVSVLKPPALVGAFSVIGKTDGSFAALPRTLQRLRCSACECGLVRWNESPHERIVNGAEAPAHAYPWQIALFYHRYSREFWRKLLAFLQANNFPGLDEARAETKPRKLCQDSDAVVQSYLPCM